MVKNAVKNVAFGLLGVVVGGVGGAVFIGVAAMLASEDRPIWPAVVSATGAAVLTWFVLFADDPKN